MGIKTANHNPERVREYIQTYHAKGKVTDLSLRKALLRLGILSLASVQYNAAQHPDGQTILEITCQEHEDIKSLGATSMLDLLESIHERISFDIEEDQKGIENLHQLFDFSDTHAQSSLYCIKTYVMHRKGALLAVVIRLFEAGMGIVRISMVSHDSDVDRCMVHIYARGNYGSPIFCDDCPSIEHYITAAVMSSGNTTDVYVNPVVE